MDDELEKTAKVLEDFNTMLKGVIEDLTHMHKEGEEFVNLLKDPFKLIMCGDIGKELDDRADKMRLYALMASNKMTVIQKLNEHMAKNFGNNKEGEE